MSTIWLFHTELLPYDPPVRFPPKFAKGRPALSTSSLPSLRTCPTTTWANGEFLRTGFGGFFDKKNQEPGKWEDVFIVKKALGRKGKYPICCFDSS